jgi:hypothetical protein
MVMRQALSIQGIVIPLCQHAEWQNQCLLLYILSSSFPMSQMTSLQEVLLETFLLAIPPWLLLPHCQRKCCKVLWHLTHGNLGPWLLQLLSFAALLLVLRQSLLQGLATDSTECPSAAHLGLLLQLSSFTIYNCNEWGNPTTVWKPTTQC